MQTVSRPRSFRQSVSVILCVAIFLSSWAGSFPVPTSAAQISETKEFQTGKNVSTLAAESTEVVLQQGANSYTGAEDVHLAEYPAYAAYNYGGMEHDLVGRMRNQSNDRKRTLYRFDVTSIPANSTIISATLELYLIDGGSASIDVEAREVLGVWEEGEGTNVPGEFTPEGVTWLTQPAIGATAIDTRAVSPR